jgi:hypothetical protein
MIAEYRETLLRSGTRFLNVTYEDLFAPYLTIDQKIEALSNVILFLGARSLNSAEEANVRNLFGPDRKVATSDVYRAIPDIEKIDEEFGSDETGWLLR